MEYDREMRNENMAWPLGILRPPQADQDPASSAVLLLPYLETGVHKDAVAQILAPLEPLLEGLIAGRKHRTKRDAALASLGARNFSRDVGGFLAAWVREEISVLG